MITERAKLRQVRDAEVQRRASAAGAKARTVEEIDELASANAQRIAALTAEAARAEAEYNTARGRGVARAQLVELWGVFDQIKAQIRSANRDRDSLADHRKRLAVRPVPREMQAAAAAGARKRNKHRRGHYAAKLNGADTGGGPPSAYWLKNETAHW